MTDAHYHELSKKLQTAPVDEINPSDPLIHYHHLAELMFSRLRRESPVHYCAQSQFGPFWSITKYKDIVEIEGNPEVFSSTSGFTIADIIPQSATARAFPIMDPPEHRAARQVVNPMASLKSLKMLEEVVSEIVSETLDQLPLNTPFDWVSRVSVEITIKALAVLMGVPQNESLKLQKWSDIAGILPQSGADIADWEAYYKELQECSIDIEHLCTEMVGRTDLINIPSMLMNSRQSQPLSKDDIFLTILMLVVAGNDTTRAYSTPFGHAFHQHPASHSTNIRPPVP